MHTFSYLAIQMKMRQVWKSMCYFDWLSLFVDAAMSSEEEEMMMIGDIRKPFIDLLLIIIVYLILSNQ